MNAPAKEKELINQTLATFKKGFIPFLLLPGRFIARYNGF